MADGHPDPLAPAAARGPVDTRHARAFAAISAVQAALVVLMVFAATAMARGMGA